MRTLVIDGFDEDSRIQAAYMEAVTNVVADRGWEYEVLTPRNLTLGPCTGCFGCWTNHPGVCVFKDDAHLVNGKIVGSDLLMIVSPLTFGGYSSLTKKILDRSIGLISPFFTMVNSEVHHKPRYDHLPAIAALGIDQEGCARCSEIFRTLVHRNAVNFHAPYLVADVVEETEAQGRKLEVRIAKLLNQVRSSKLSGLPDRRISIEEIMAGPSDGPLLELPRERPVRALFIVGSPKAKSTSSSISDEFMFKLRGKGWETWRQYIMPSLKSEGRLLELLNGMETADLVVLLSPLYVDSLPAPLTRILELVSKNREKGTGKSKPGLMAVFNCGFPEASHNFTALAITRHFAEKTGYEWLGGLALGMGGAIDGRSFKDSGRMIRNVSEALDLTVENVAHGKPVPREAFDLMAKPFIPRRVYIALGNLGWKKQAKKHGVLEDLNARPYK